MRMPLPQHFQSTSRVSRLCLYHMLMAMFCLTGTCQIYADESPVNEFRKPQSEAELRDWLENMAWHHRYSLDEMHAVTGLSQVELEQALDRFGIRPETRPKRGPDAKLLVLPYPGGRHPRIGFLDGALKPQRETKISVFTPWDENGYVVVDVPEAIWSNLGLTYLAHTHIPTVWTRQGIQLPRLEWQRKPEGRLEVERTLPNGIVFKSEVTPGRDGVRMKLTLKNGTDQALSDLRVQNCVMLKAAVGFARQTNDNKLFQSPWVACRSDSGERWVITAWTPCHRPWGNPPCPCLHSDPKFPDCPPGETRSLDGWLSFYQGGDIQAELKRLESVAFPSQKSP